MDLQCRPTGTWQPWHPSAALESSFPRDQSQPLIFYSPLQSWRFSHRHPQKNETNQSLTLIQPLAPNTKSPKIPPLSQITGWHTLYLSNQGDFTKSAFLCEAIPPLIQSLLLPLRRDRKLHEIDVDRRGKCLIQRVLAVILRWWVQCWCLVGGLLTTAEQMLEKFSIKHERKCLHGTQCTMYFVHCTLHPRFITSQAKISKQCAHSFVFLCSFFFFFFLPQNLSNPYLPLTSYLVLSILSSLTAVQCRFFTGWRYGRDRRGTMNNCWRYFYSDPLWSPFRPP